LLVEEVNKSRDVDTFQVHRKFLSVRVFNAWFSIFEFAAVFSAFFRLISIIRCWIV